MEYTFKKGRHYPTPCMGIDLRLFPHQREYNLACDVRFHDNCSYDIDTDQSDINKLLGFAYGPHHRESDRVGWRYIKDTGMMELMLYSYEHSKVIKKSLGSVPLNEWFSLSMNVVISDDKRLITIRINNKTRNFTLEAPRSYWFQYRLTPYFGGNRTSPHDMVISIVD